MRAKHLMCDMRKYFCQGLLISDGTLELDCLGLSLSPTPASLGTVRESLPQLPHM